MRARRSRRALRWGLVIAVIVMALAMLRPWTVVPIQTTAARTFNAVDYVESVWGSRVLPAAESGAIELQTFMQGQGRPEVTGRPPRAVFVKGVATVSDVDRRSRVGLARLRLPWAGQGEAAIQIGPVLRGTALRDALDFVQFTDFVNQLEFASVANALNERAIADVIGPLDVDALAGREITFLGAVSTPPAATLEIVPVRLDATGGAP